ncbi:MAG: PAAR domain-containing protein, partial [Acetobacteraceae bacterium]|nr:PAAR domain-containing protein [Acetobacteraceae bacterium]
MPAEPAARLLDEISHTDSMTGFLVGALVGLAAGVAIVALTVATGGAALAVVAAAGAAVATTGGSALVGEALGETYETATGSIVQLGSPNVLVNMRPAARAMLDAAVCSTHAPGPPKSIAQGSETVLINGVPAARKTSLIACGAHISSGSPDVLIGGPTATLLDISPEVPTWMNSLATAMVWVGSAVALGAGAAAAFAASGVCGLIAFGGEVAGGFIGSWLGGGVGGSIGEAIGGERGRIIGEFLGSVLGGFVGGGLGKRAAAGHPVDVATGELFTEELDFEIAGPLPFTWRRTYISSSTRGAANGGPLGESWHHSFDMALLQLEDGSGFAARLADGRYGMFCVPTPWRPAVNTAEQLALETDGREFWITNYDGVHYYFGDANCTNGIRVLERVVDPNENAITLEWDCGRLRSVIDSVGREFEVESDAAGRIVGV